jgi:hypothetical protein
LFFFYILSFSSVELNAQTPVRRDVYLDYIDIYAHVAIEEMRVYHIPASITLSQALIESGAGKSDLAVKANNHFGIKCHIGWVGESINQNDDTPGECFRSYKTAEESFRDHSKFLTEKTRYAALFKLDIYDYKAWANGLKQSGYATNPRYADILIKVITDYELDQFDRLDGKVPLRAHKILKTGKTGRPLKAEINYQYFNPDYFQPGSENFTYVEDSKTGRKIYMNNGTLFVFANKGDSFASIGSDMNVSTGKLAHLNEIKRKEPLMEGQMVYIERKKLNGIRDTYTVQPNDTWYAISQFTGVQIDALKELNAVVGEQAPRPGTVLNLKGHVKRTFLQRLFGKS